MSGVAVGSYERGERAVTVARLVKLAELYEVEPADLLPTGHGPRAAVPGRVAIDLTRVARLPAYRAGPLMQAARRLPRRDDSTFLLGGEDLARVARAYGLTASAAADMFADWGVCRPASDPAAR